MNTHKNKLLEGPILKSLVAIAIPIILTNLLQNMYNLTDAFWVGRLGGNAVAAVSVSFPIMFLTFALSAGFAVAGSTLIAQYIGAKNQKMVNHVTAQTLLMIVIVAIVLGAVGFVLAPGILNLMGVAHEVFSQALGFMRVAFVGLIFVFGFSMFQAVMNGVGKTRIPTIIVASTVLLNFLLDPLFIFGFGPIPALGVTGAAVATIGTQFVASVIGMFVLFSGKYGIHVRLADFKPDLAFIKRAFKLGFPASIEQSARALGFTVMTFLIATFGTLTIAAYGVAGNVNMFVVIPALGFSIAISVLVGQNIGAGNAQRAEAIARLGSILSFCILTALGVIAFIFAPLIASFFVPGDTEIIKSAAYFIRIVALTYGCIGVQMSISGVLRAAGNMKVPMMMAIVSQWVIQFPLAYILSKHTNLGATGLWYSFPIANILMTIIALIWFKNTKWKDKRLTQEEKLIEKVTEEIFVEEVVR